MGFLTLLLPVWTWVRGHSWTQIFHAACILGIGILAFWAVVHERNVGYAECEAKQVKAAEALKADHDAMQAKLDKLAGEDAKLKATKIPVLDFGCHLTPAQIKTLQKALQ